jgi:hypothetical protein
VRRGLPVRPGVLSGISDLAINLLQHPDEHRSESSVLLAVDQQLGDGARLRIPPELPDPVGAVEVGEQQDVEQLGAESRPSAAAALQGARKSARQ